MILVGGAVLLPDSLFHNATAAVLWRAERAVHPEERLRALLADVYQTLVYELMSDQVRVNHVDMQIENA